MSKKEDRPKTTLAKRHLKKAQDAEAEKRRQQRLGQLSRAPGKCPLGCCDQIVFPSGLLVHLLHKHSREPTCTLATVYDSQPVRLTIDPRHLQPGVTHSLAILLYAGVEGKRRTEPGRRYLSFPNAGLLNERRRLENHLAIVLMICKTTFYALLEDKELESELAAINPDTSGLYVLWLVAPVTSRRMFYTLTAFDRYYVQSRSVIRKLKNYVQSQNPSDFLPTESDYLLLREAEAMEMLFAKDSDFQIPDKVEPLSSGIQLEIIVHDNPAISPLDVRTSNQLLETYNGLPGGGPKMPRIKLNLNRGAHGKLALNRKPLSKATLVTHPESKGSGLKERLKPSRVRQMVEEVPRDKFHNWPGSRENPLQKADRKRSGQAEQAKKKAAKKVRKASSEGRLPEEEPSPPTHQKSSDESLPEKYKERYQQQWGREKLQQQRRQGGQEEEEEEGGAEQPQPSQEPQTKAGPLSSESAGNQLLLKPISDPMQKVRDAVMQTVKDALMMAAQETVITEIEVPTASVSVSVSGSGTESVSELNPPEGETKPKSEAEEEPEVGAVSDSNSSAPLDNIPGMAITIESTSGSEWDNY